MAKFQWEAQTRLGEKKKGVMEAETADQVAIFFLAGHETGASALSWTPWLLAAHPGWQERCASTRPCP